ncbi:MAG: DUF1844 domain-containing protein [Thermodesulfobacteriota bacterium]
MNSADDQGFILKNNGKTPSKTTGDLPAINFSTFIFSLNSSALVHLGVVPDPTTGVVRRELVIAKQTIDILAMLEEKTKGNLTDEEQKLLSHILHDLRIQFVTEKNRQ